MLRQERLLQVSGLDFLEAIGVLPEVHDAGRGGPGSEAPINPFLSESGTTHGGLVLRDDYADFLARAEHKNLSGECMRCWVAANMGLHNKADIVCPMPSNSVYML
jgi:hypothetical protein